MSNLVTGSLTRLAELLTYSITYLLVAAPAAAEVPVDQLPDLTSSVVTVVTLKSRDNFENEFRYDVSVRNQAGEPIESSLVLVLDQITDLAGKDALDRIEVLGQDGETAEGQPYFKIPLTGKLAGYAQSPPATVRLRNSAYTIIFTPSFRVRGIRRSLAQKSAETTSALIQLLQKKGFLTEEDLKEVQGVPTQP
jgi:hypothetical protein